MEDRTTTDAFVLHRPDRRETPVIFSSPHSGRDYPASFIAGTVLDDRMIRSSEDAFVDLLFGAAPGFGAPLLAARAPRAFLDLNRAADELDPALIEGIVRAPHNPRVSSGLGVIPRVVANGRAIYRGKLPLAEADRRLTQFWHPWHDALRNLVEESHRQFGEAILIDCHSMPHEAIEAHARPGHAQPEIVLGDRFGSAAARDVMDHVESAFRRAGLRVARNAPFAGAFITQTYGRPARGRHAIQVEIDRSLYMDEVHVRPRRDFADFQQVISDVVGRITLYGRETMPLAAE